MRLSRHADDPQLFFYADRGKVLVTFDRGDYWQCGFSVPKGAAEELQARSIEELRAGIVEVAPFLGERVTELRSWSDVKLLTVRVDRLRQWYRPGLVCIGDAAHAMSPVGGVGINLAIQDAVAAQHTGRTPSRRLRQRGRSRENTTPSRVSHSADAKRAGVDPETNGAWPLKAGTSTASVASPAPGTHDAPTPGSRALYLCRRPPGAREDPRCLERACACGRERG
jgi:hypothetical protein